MRRWLLGLSLAATMLPLLCWLSLHLTWLVAMLALGHQPRPSIDDPKDIAAIIPFYWATLILMMLSPLAIGVLVLPLAAALLHLRWRRAALLTCVGMLSIVIGIALLRRDPFDVWVWFMDRATTASLTAISCSSTKNGTWDECCRYPRICSRIDGSRMS